MSIERARAYLKEFGMEERIMELAESSVDWEEMLQEAAGQAVMTKIGYMKQ